MNFKECETTDEEETFLEGGSLIDTLCYNFYSYLVARSVDALESVEVRAG